MANPSMMKAALTLAGRGFAVHPLYEPDPQAPGGCSCGKPDCATAGKHPRLAAWQQAATTDPGQVRYWWRTWPSANIGIVTGRELPGGGFLAVLDVDPRNDGDASLEELETLYSPLPDTRRVDTGGGGFHYFFTTPEAVRGAKVAPGLDLKGSNGYVVAPPSLHSSGRRYEWAR
jgi:hypothetical protein